MKVNDACLDFQRKIKCNMWCLSIAHNRVLEFQPANYETNWTKNSHNLLCYKKNAFMCLKKKHKVDILMRFWMFDLILLDCKGCWHPAEELWLFSRFPLWSTSSSKKVETAKYSWQRKYLKNKIKEGSRKCKMQILLGSRRILKIKSKEKMGIP